MKFHFQNRDDIPYHYGMKYIIQISVALLVSGPAFGLDYIECWDGDCLTIGWTARAVDRTGFTDFQCRENDCLKRGWITGGTLGLEVYTSCKAGGCFKEGWYEIHRWTQETRQNVTCHGGDCLTQGWTSYTPAGAAVTRCVNNSCRKEGWTTQGPGAKNEHIACTRNDCFHSGWVRSSSF